MGRAPCCTKIGLRRGPWSIKEDTTLTNYIQQHGEGLWRSLPKNAGLLRCGKSCRLRWMNYLRPGIKRGNISQDEEDLIVRLHGLLGNRWSLIAGRLPGRTDNEIKNYWNTHLVKKLKNSIPKPNTPKIPKPKKSTPTPNAATKKKKSKKVNEAVTKVAEEQKVYLPKAIRFSRSSSYDSLASGTSSSEGGVMAAIGSYVPVMWPDIGEDDLVGFVMPENDQSDGDVNMWERVYDEFFQLL